MTRPVLLAAAALAACVLLLPTGSPGDAGESITVTTPSPAYGQPVWFDAVYTQAHKKDWPPRVYNPVVAASCPDGGWQAQFGWQNHNLGGGFFSGSSYLIFQGSTPGTCYIYLEYTDGRTDQTEILASSTFPIG